MNPESKSSGASDRVRERKKGGFPLPAAVSRKAAVSPSGEMPWFREILSRGRDIHVDIFWDKTLLEFAQVPHFQT